MCFDSFIYCVLLYILRDIECMSAGIRNFLILKFQTEWFDGVSFLIYCNEKYDRENSFQERKKLNVESFFN